MSDPAPDQSESPEGNEEPVPVPQWLRATMDDLQGLDFEAPISTQIRLTQANSAICSAPQHYPLIRKRTCPIPQLRA
jgi:hypothetical protein